MYTAKLDIVHHLRMLNGSTVRLLPKFLPGGFLRATPTCPSAQKTRGALGWPQGYSCGMYHLYEATQCLNISYSCLWTIGDHPNHPNMLMLNGETKGFGSPNCLIQTTITKQKSCSNSARKISSATAWPPEQELSCHGGKSRPGNHRSEGFSYSAELQLQLFFRVSCNAGWSAGGIHKTINIQEPQNPKRSK